MNYIYKEKEPEHWEVRQLTIDLMSVFTYSTSVNEYGEPEVDFRFDELAEALIRMGYHKIIK